MGYGTSLGTAHEDEISSVLEPLTSREISDRKEINANEASGDFQSRFGSIDIRPVSDSTMPLEASRKLTDALKQVGGSGTPGNSFETKLAPGEESAFQDWKAKNAPNDTGKDYDLRGAFKGGAQPADNGHWPDTWKKPNHPTFSDQSQYAKYAPDQAGTWDGDRYIPPAQASSVADDWFGKEGTPADIRPALGHFYETVKNAFKLPGDVYSGKVPAGSIQEIERATDLAGLMVGGPAPVAKGMADGSLGSFMGVQSKTINKTNLYKAQDMEMQGFHTEDIWNETGTFRGADSRWRQVILDKESNLKREGLEVSPPTPFDKTKIGKPETVNVPDRFKNFPEKASLQEMYDYLKSGPGKHVLLGDVLHHPELYRAYPWLKNVRISPMPEYHKGYLGMAKDNDIWMSAAPEKEFRSTLMHEVQHIIQDREGFARGGNPQMFKPEALAPAEKQFNVAKTDALNEIRKDTGLSHFEMGFAIGTVKSNLERGVAADAGSFAKDIIDKIKVAGHFKKIENIAKAQNLLDNAALEWSDKYRRLMGEVESRNVQARLDFDAVTNAIHSPQRTESMVTPRSQQINPDDIAGHIGRGSASEPTPFRRGANDNLPEGHPDRPYNIREPNMIGSKEMDDAIDAQWKRFGELQRIQAEEEKLLFSGKNDEFTVAKIKKLQKEYQDLHKGD